VNDSWPSLVDFKILAAEIYRSLPKKFRILCEEKDLIIRVEDSPTDVLGLFQGIGLPFRTESAPPNLISLYRRPILAYWSRHQDTLDAVIAHVLVHEIGHHFGLTDDDMEAIEAQAE
jgi:predicted Zn-dependent protease with MMP-like domain